MPERDYQLIRAVAAGPRLTLTLNRPERRNALGPQMINELLYAIEDEHAESGRCVVITGRGRRSEGADFSQVAARWRLREPGATSRIDCESCAFREASDRARQAAMVEVSVVAVARSPRANDASAALRNRRRVVPFMIGRARALVSRRRLGEMMLTGGASRRRGR